MATVIADEKRIDDIVRICSESVGNFKEEIKKRASYTSWAEEDEMLTSAIGLWSAKTQQKAFAAEFVSEREKVEKKLHENEQQLDESQKRLDGELQRFSNLQQNQENLLREKEALFRGYEKGRRAQEQEVAVALRVFNAAKQEFQEDSGVEVVSQTEWVLK